jgi:predicted nucleotidyltransferase component of viral defense system
MRLQTKSRLGQSIVFTAQQMKILPIVRKDYWVTYVLQSYFFMIQLEQKLYSKGTALSKCFGLIERFSEDIVSIVLRREQRVEINQKAN